jgi:hypothetical protein
VRTVGHERRPSSCLCAVQLLRVSLGCLRTCVVCRRRRRYLDCRDNGRSNDVVVIATERMGVVAIFHRQYGFRHLARCCGCCCCCCCCNLHSERPVAEPHQHPRRKSHFLLPQRMDESQFVAFGLEDSLKLAIMPFQARKLSKDFSQRHFINCLHNGQNV